MQTTTDAIEINPPQKEIGTVIWLHGLGADGHDFVPIVPALFLPHDLPLRFVFPNAPMRPVTINNGYIMRAWYDIYSFGNNQQIDEKGITESRKLLESLIERERQRGIFPNKIILAGFSQGAVMALTTGLRYPESVAGIMCLSGYLPEPNKILAEATAANFVTPIFVAHGTEDTVVPYQASEQIVELLKNKYPLTWKSYQMGHSVNDEEIADISRWLMGVFGG